MEAKATSGWTPLHIAAWSGSVESADSLISKGADVNSRTISATTPLDMARANEREEVAALIKQNGGKTKA